jgi:hypothetical protein
VNINSLLRTFVRLALCVNNAPSKSRSNGSSTPPMLKYSPQHPPIHFFLPPKSTNPNHNRWQKSHGRARRSSNPSMRNRRSSNPSVSLLKYPLTRYCYHDKLNIAGNCRMCLVEMERSPKPGIPPRLWVDRSGELCDALCPWYGG